MHGFSSVSWRLVLVFHAGFSVSCMVLDCMVLVFHGGLAHNPQT